MNPPMTATRIPEIEKRGTARAMAMSLVMSEIPISRTAEKSSVNSPSIVRKSFVKRCVIRP